METSVSVVMELFRHMWNHNTPSVSQLRGWIGLMVLPLTNSLSLYFLSCVVVTNGLRDWSSSCFLLLHA